MTASKTPFGYPLQFGMLAEFCHPVPGHALALPVWSGGDALVGNGYIALRCSRGLWHPSDFEAPGIGVEARFEKLPWARFATLSDQWRAMDDVRGNLYRSAPIYPWTEKGGCTPTPVWWVNGAFLARLSHLQLIARLPRCEVHVGAIDAGAPLLFRFSGGCGMLVADKKLTLASFSIFEPRRHEDGARLGANKGPCVLPPKRPFWKDFEPEPKN